MSSASLGVPYVLSDKSANKLVELEKNGSAPKSTPGFESRLATTKKLESLNDRIMKSSRRLSESRKAG